MSTVAEIGEAIRKLPPQEAWKLAADLREYLDGLWDKQFEEDVKASRLVDLIAPDGFLWIWIGRHDAYERLLRQ